MKKKVVLKVNNTSIALDVEEVEALTESLDIGIETGLIDVDNTPNALKLLDALNHAFYTLNS